MYLVDGAQNQNRMDGGYALKLPVEAIAEFRILTQTAPPEYGGTAGATTSVVTRSGTNQFHGARVRVRAQRRVRCPELLFGGGRAAEAAPVRRHRSAARSTRDRLLFFGYYEGFRNKQGMTTTSTVPTALERQGDFSQLGVPLLNLAAGGVPFPGNKIPAGRDQSGLAERAEHVSARQRVAVDLPRDGHPRERLRPGRRPARFQRCLPTIRSSGATRIPAATTSIRFPFAARMCPASPRATISRRISPRSRTRTFSRRR